jgi:hypothetical protein
VSSASPREGRTSDAPGRSLATRGESLRLAALAAVAPVIALLSVLAQPAADRFNDYHDYWLAGRLVSAGGNPYDLAQLTALADRSGLHFLVGGGYSYLPPFAIAMVPLAALPFELSAWLFGLVSIVVFALAVGWWLARWHRPAEANHRRLAALLAGCSPPVLGSIVVGQVNLLVGALVAVGLASVMAETPGRPGRPGTLSRGAAGIALGLATVVKSYPGAVALPIVLGRRFAVGAGIALGFGLPLLVAAQVTPAATGGAARGLASLLEPDGYWTNQSLNGFASRLVADSDRTSAPLPGVMPPELLSAGLIVVFAAATLAVLWRGRAALASPAGLALACAFVLVAATAAAPKNSFWNHVPALVAAGTLLAVDASDLRLGALPRVERWLLGAWATAALAQTAVDGIGFVAPPRGIPALLASLALYGLLCLWFLLGRRLRGFATGV